MRSVDAVELSGGLTDERVEGSNRRRRVDVGIVDAQRRRDGLVEVPLIARPVYLEIIRQRDVAVEREALGDFDATHGHGRPASGHAAGGARACTRTVARASAW